jgi:hypothetical protein
MHSSSHSLHSIQSIQGGGGGGAPDNHSPQVQHAMHYGQQQAPAHSHGGLQAPQSREGDSYFGQAQMGQQQQQQQGVY